MKLFQRLLVAPAALGLMAPLAANAADLNINGVSDYSASSIEAQSYSDVLPTDWAFKALTDLAERNGCAVATPSESMTRYEAAALLNKCLGNVAEVTADEKLLLNEFSPELAVIKGRVDGLEARIGEFEAGQFSSSTQMSGNAAFITGYVDDDNETDTDSTTMEYMYQLNLNTSFTGKDSLTTVFKTGNVSDHFADQNQGTYLSVTNDNANVLKLDALFYQFPVGDSVQAWVGPVIENTDMLASSGSIYAPITKQFANGGNGSAYGSAANPGFGAAWTQATDDPSDGRFEVSASFTSADGTDSSATKGLFGEDSRNFLMTKVGYGAPRWQVSVATSFKDNAASGAYDGQFHTTDAEAAEGNITAYGLRAYWKPETTGAIPEVQLGYDLASVADATAGRPDETEGWMIGLGWKDALIDGNTAGLALGSRMHATSYKSDATRTDDAEDNSVWEAYYTFNVNDGVSITPALFGGSDVQADGKDVTGGVILTEFKF